MLNNARIMYLWNNHLRGQIPSSLSNCTNLLQSDVNDNQFTGRIPAELCSKNTLLTGFYLAWAGIVSDNPTPGLVRRLQGSRRSVTRTVCCRKILPAPAASSLRNSMPTLDPALRPSLGHLPFRLAASLPASLRPALRRSVGVRRESIGELRIVDEMGEYPQLNAFGIYTQK